MVGRIVTGATATRKHAGYVFDAPIGPHPCRPSKRPPHHHPPYRPIPPPTTRYFSSDGSTRRKIITAVDEPSNRKPGKSTDHGNIWIDSKVNAHIVGEWISMKFTIPYIIVGNRAFNPFVTNISYGKRFYTIRINSQWNDFPDVGNVSRPRIGVVGGWKNGWEKGRETNGFHARKRPYVNIGRWYWGNIAFESI